MSMTTFSNEVPAAERVEVLRQLLGEAACRQLGIYPIPADFKLSVVIPVYNEERWIREVIRRVRAVDIPKEIIVVDDCSTDGTRDTLRQLEGEDGLRILYQPHNQGKGAALREGFRHVTGDVVIVQDADLEYDPAEYARLIAPILDNRADVVFGSRFVGENHRVLYYWHYVANKLLTTLSNIFTNLNLTDMETCYKVFRREVLAARSDTKLAAEDVLLVDAPTSGSGEKSELFSGLRLERLPLEGSYFTDQSQQIGMAEVILPPNSSLIGKSMMQLTFRRRYHLNLIGLRRGQRAIDGKLLEEELQTGDTLLLIGPWKEIRQLQTQMHDFVVLSLPAEINRVAPALSQAPYALLSLIVMIVLMITGIVPNVIAALIGCLLMGLFRCIDMNSAYKSIS